MNDAHDNTITDLDMLRKLSPPEPATLKQIKFYKDLIHKKQLDDMIAGMPDAYLIVMRDLTKAIHEHSLETVEASKTFAKTDLSKFISQMVKQPDKSKERDAIGNANAAAVAGNFANEVMVQWQEASAATTPTPKEFAPYLLEDGMYRIPATETIYKVYHTVHGNNVQVAKRLKVIDPGQPNTDGTWKNPVRKATVKFVYEGRKPLYSLTPEMKLSLEQSRDFGALYGTCCICSRTLTNELSIALGIGPVCGDREFGGEFKFMVDAKKVELNLSEQDGCMTDTAKTNQDELAEALHKLINSGQATLSQALEMSPRDIILKAEGLI